MSNFHILLANVNSRSHSLCCRPSVCLSVCNARAPYSGGCIVFGNSMAFGTLAIRWHPQKNYGRSPGERLRRGS